MPVSDSRLSLFISASTSAKIKEYGIMRPVAMPPANKSTPPLAAGLIYFKRHLNNPWPDSRGLFLGTFNASAELIDTIAAMQTATESAFGHDAFCIALAFLMTGMAFELNIFSHF